MTELERLADEAEREFIAGETLPIEKLCQPTREQRRTDLARAMGWTNIRWHTTDEVSARPLDNSFEINGTTPDGQHFVSLPNPYDSADDSRALVLWLAEDDERWDRFCFEFRINVSIPAILMDYQDFEGELIPNIASLAKRMMTAPLPVIADAAWQAIQEKQ